jgi:hypothetical protein
MSLLRLFEPTNQGNYEPKKVLAELRGGQ